MIKPILFNEEMVRAILEGRKTVTRRVVKPKPEGDGSRPKPLTTRPGYWNTWGDDYVYRQPYQPGDILWVRETWRPFSAWVGSSCGCTIEYKAGGKKTFDGFPIDVPGKITPWRPSIHMPREAARLFLWVTDVRVERLQDMRLIDCEKEGVQLNFIEKADLVNRGVRARKRFAGVWDSTIPKHSNKFKRYPYYWADNPWVWVIEFERCDKPEGFA